MMSARFALPQWLVFGAILALSLGLIVILKPFAPLPLVIAIACTSSFLIAMFWHDGSWWKWIHLLFLPLVFVFLQFELSPSWYLFAFILSWFVFGKVMVSRVPLYLSNQQALSELEVYVPHGARFLDVGAGTGTVLHFLVKRRPDLSLAGVEQAKAPWLLGKMRLPSTVAWINADYQEIDLADFDCVYAFLSPAVMSDLWLQVQTQMKPGSLFISNSFAIPDVVPDQIIELNDWKSGKLLIWRM